jgi:hypothetical protein
VSGYFRNDCPLSPEYVAYTRLLEYLYTEIKTIKSGNIFPNMNPTWEIPTDSNWTDSKVSLVELMYSLIEARSINNGNFDINQLANIFEHVFHIDLGKYYHVFNEIKERKQTTQYIDKLKKALQNKIDEDPI